MNTIEEGKRVYRQKLESILRIVGREIRPDQPIEELEAEHRKFCEELEKHDLESLQAELEAMLNRPEDFDGTLEPDSE